MKQETKNKIGEQVTEFLLEQLKTQEKFRIREIKTADYKTGTSKHYYAIEYATIYDENFDEYEWEEIIEITLEEYDEFNAYAAERYKNENN